MRWAGAPAFYTADLGLETPNGRDFTHRDDPRTRRAGGRNAASSQAAPLLLYACSGFGLTVMNEVFEGTMEGQVIWRMRGEQGHGYDRYSTRRITTSPSEKWIAG